MRKNLRTWTLGQLLLRRFELLNLLAEVLEMCRWTMRPGDAWPEALWPLRRDLLALEAEIARR